MLRSVEKSLELLRTDHLDLVQMHSLREREERIGGTADGGGTGAGAGPSYCSWA